MAEILPIYSLRESLVALAASADSVRAWIEAPTGSGKSTGVPQMLIDDAAMEGEVWVLQPRRVAARMLARRVAWERGGSVGGEVGYRVRFDQSVSKKTRICYATEGILRRRLLGDPMLRGVSAVVFDEYHERHVEGDVGLALLSRLQAERRPDLQLYVMSATMEGMRAGAAFEQAPVLRAGGRLYPVEVRHAGREWRRGEMLWDRAVAMLEEAVLDGAGGDVLIFMPGVHEIRKTLALLAGKSWCRGWALMPLYGELPPEKQDAAIAPAGRRKIVVATNLAETSLTIDGVCIVVDSGLARMAQYDVGRGLNTLTIGPISRASADQRAGRAGRTAPGLCLRMWTAANHAARPRQGAPEIQRIDPSGIFLDLHAMGFADMAGFPWIDAPHEDAREQAEDLLRRLGAVGRDGALTETGKAMSAYPIHPRLGRFLVEMESRRVLALGCVVAALCEGRGLVDRGKVGEETLERFSERHDISDFQAPVRLLVASAAEGWDGGNCRRKGVRMAALKESQRLAAALWRQSGRGEKSFPWGMLPGDEADWQAVAASLLLTYSDHLAVQISQGTRTCAVSGGRRGKIAPDSRVGRAKVLVAVEIVELEGRKLEVVLRDITALDDAILEEVKGDWLEEVSFLAFDETQKRVVRRVEKRIGDLVLESKHSPDIAPGPEAAAVLAEAIVGQGLALPKWDASVERWCARLNFLAAAMPELELPVFGEEEKVFLIEQLCQQATTHREVREKAVWPVLRSWLSPEQRGALDAYAPEKVRFENGCEAQVIYTSGAQPEVEVILQRLYGVEKNPRVADGRVPVVVTLLAPSRRPVQKTSDLGTFWKTSYAGVKNELKGRYPKHEWR